MKPYLYPRAPLTSAAVKIICHGNSHVAGEGAASTSLRWTDRMVALTPGITMVNTGVGGQSITAMIGNASTAVDAHLDATKLNILFAQEFGNEMAANGRDAAAAHAKWVTYCDARRAAASAAGKRLYIITVGLHPTGAATTYAGTLARVASVQAANALIRANWRNYCDQFVDLGEFAPFKALFDGGSYHEADFLACGMYSRDDGTPLDRVHMGNAGHARVGQIMAQALKRVRRTL